MRPLILLFTAIFILNAIPGNSQIEQVFELTDGYFRTQSGRPVHLTHDNVKVSVSLGGEYYLWLDFKVRKGITANPCSVREEQACKLSMYLAQKDSSGQEQYVAGWKSNGLEFRTDESVGFGIPAVTVPRVTPFDHVYLIVKIAKDGKEYFRKEWPVSVWAN